jgi:hypothetical protein
VDIAERVAQVEGSNALGRGVRAVEEGAVHAGVRRADALVARLDPELALRQRVTGHLDAAEPARRLRELEHVDVDLGPEDLAHAAHVATARQLVLVAVEEAAADLDAAPGLDQLVAESSAPATLGGFGAWAF